MDAGVGLDRQTCQVTLGGFFLLPSSDRVPQPKTTVCRRSTPTHRHISHHPQEGRRDRNPLSQRRGRRRRERQGIHLRAGGGREKVEAMGWGEGLGGLGKPSSLHPVAWKRWEPRPHCPPTTTAADSPDWRRCRSVPSWPPALRLPQSVCHTKTPPSCPPDSTPNPTANKGLFRPEPVGRRQRQSYVPKAGRVKLSQA